MSSFEGDTILLAQGSRAGHRHAGPVLVSIWPLGRDALLVPDSEFGFRHQPCNPGASSSTKWDVIIVITSLSKLSNTQ